VFTQFLIEPRARYKWFFGRRDQEARDTRNVGHLLRLVPLGSFGHATSRLVRRWIQVGFYGAILGHLARRLLALSG
jgi:hypothetical protein